MSRQRRREGECVEYSEENDKQKQAYRDGGCIKDNDGKLVVGEEEIKELWRSYYE